MRKYWIVQGEFYNVYDLYYTETELEEQILTDVHKEAKQITRKEAISKCIQEKDRCKYDKSFSGYGSQYIYPVLYNGLEDSDVYWNLINQGRAEIKNTYFFELIKRGMK